MAVTTLDGVIAGLVPATRMTTIMKISGSAEAAGFFHSWWYTNGVPYSITTGNAAGINGQACVPSLYADRGPFYRVNPASGNAYLGRWEMSSSLVGSILLVDRLWENSGLDVTSTGAQAITPVALPARDRDGSTNGVGVMAAIEWSAAGGAGVPLVTLTYTDEAGNAGATASFTGVTTPVAGTFEVFPLAAGDYGVRAPTSFIQNATRVSGTMHLVLFRVLAVLGMTEVNRVISLDAVTAGMPRIYDDSCLQMIWLASATSGPVVNGRYLETQG